MNKSNMAVIVGLIAAIGGVSLFVVTRLIRSEGERVRQTIEETADDVVQDNVNSAIDKAGDQAKGVAETIISGAGDVLEKSTTDSDDILNDIKDIFKGRAASPNEPGDAGGNSPLKVPRLEPSSAIGDLAGLARTLSKTVDELAQDVLKFESNEEKQIGQEVHQTIRQHHNLLNDPRLVAHIEELAAPLLKGRQRTDLSFTFSVIGDEQLNAFSHLGGYVYVNQGLLESVQSDTELQFVLAHEIAHVDLGHCVSQLTYAARASEFTGKIGGGLTQLAYHAIALGYSEDKEFDADAWAYRKLRSLGVAHPQILAFHKRMLANMREQEIDTEPRKPESALDSVVQEVENHFRSHPPMTERIARLEAMKNEPQGGAR